MKLTMLGTGNALASECYNTCFVLEDDKQYFMVDGGGGNTILHQLKRAGIHWMDIRHIFVTHKHIDHILGIVWMIRMICQYMDHGDYIGECTIYAHDEVISLLIDLSDKLLKKSEVRFIQNRLHLIEVQDGKTLDILNRRTTFFDIHSTKAKQFGFCMEISEGETLTCCGDEPYTEYEREYAYGCKWLLHEAFCLYSQADQFEPYEKHHSTVKDACINARDLQVKNLVLYHTEDLNLKHRKELYINEGKQYYKGNIVVPDDLEVIEL